MDAFNNVESPMQLMIKVLKIIHMKKSALDRLAKAEREKLCVACMKPLGESRVIRGCHESCWKATKRAVAAGKFTEEQRVQEGKMLPAASGGRNPVNPVSIEAASS
jgi:hypothetical protein